jgi:hypothetical protein
MRVEVRPPHRECLIVYQAVVVAIDHGVNTQAEDVLMMNCKDTGVDHCAKGNFNTFIDGLGTKDPGSSDFVLDFSSLVKDEGQDVLVVRHSDDRLQHKFSVTCDSCPSCAIISVTTISRTLQQLWGSAYVCFHPIPPSCS